MPFVKPLTFSTKHPTIFIRKMCGKTFRFFQVFSLSTYTPNNYIYLVTLCCNVAKALKSGRNKPYYNSRIIAHTHVRITEKGKKLP